MSNVPKLRFREFEGEYKEYLFHDIFLFSTGKNIKQKEASPEFEIPCIRYGELYHMYNEVVYKIINRTNLDKSELLFSQGNEILLPSAGEDPLDIGSASALTLKNIAIGRTINILRPKHKNIYSQKYVSYYINEKLKRKISTLAKGSSISNVYNSDLKKLKIILPTLDEQQKIDDFITSIDKKIEQLKQKKTLLENYKKGLMQKIFSQEIRFSPTLVPTLSVGTSSGFDDWEEKRLGDIAIVNPRNKKLPTKFIYIDLESVSNGSLLRENTILNSEAPSRAQRFLAKEDILFQMLRPYQKNNYFFNLNGEYVASTGYAQIRALESSEYLYYFLHTNDFVNNVLVRCTGTSYPAINSSDLLKIKIKNPQKEEQEKIAIFLSSIDQKITQNNQVLEEMKMFKKGLLQQMFV